jgi:hypothetical protein
VNIVLPIVFFVVGVGLFAKRITPRVWWAIAAWIALVIGLRLF